LIRLALSTPLFFDRKASGDPLISFSSATAGPLLDLGVLADLDAEQWHRRLGAVSALSDVLRDGDAAIRAAAKVSLQRRLEQERDFGVRAALELALSRESLSAVGVPHPSMPSTEASSPPIAEALAPAIGSVVRQTTVQEHKSVAAKTESNIAEREARALLAKGASFAPNRREEAIAVWDDLIARFGSASETPLRELVAQALINKGHILDTIGRHGDAIAVYDDILARFGIATEPALSEPVAQTLINKGQILDTIGRHEDAIAVYDDILARFGTATEPALRPSVARTLENKASMLGRLGRSHEAIAVYDDFLARFGTATEWPSLGTQVAGVKSARDNLRIGDGSKRSVPGPWSRQIDFSNEGSQDRKDYDPGNQDYSSDQDFSGDDFGGGDFSGGPAEIDFSEEPAKMESDKVWAELLKKMAKRPIPKTP
jgi:tetratricopeptide (TPR) repeat protein